MLVADCVRDICWKIPIRTTFILCVHVTGPSAEPKFAQVFAQQFVAIAVNTTSDEARYRVVVLELTDVVSRIRTDRPNIYVGVTTRTPEQLADGLNNGRYTPAWVRNNVVGILDTLAPTGTFTHMDARQVRDDLTRQLRTKGYTVNRNTTAYRTYVIDLHNPDINDAGKGYVYVGQTSKTPEERLHEHLTGARSRKGHNLASRTVSKYGRQLNYDLMTQRIYLTQQQALKAERRLAERLRQQGYIVEGGH